MRRYPPLHENESSLDPDAALGEAMARILNMPASAAGFVHSNIDDEAAIKATPDWQEKYICERAEQSVWVVRKLRSMRDAVAGWLDTNDSIECDNYFADVANMADPLQRVHHVERSGLTRGLFTDY